MSNTLKRFFQNKTLLVALLAAIFVVLTLGIIAFQYFEYKKQEQEELISQNRFIEYDLQARKVVSGNLFEMPKKIDVLDTQAQMEEKRELSVLERRKSYMQPIEKNKDTGYIAIIVTNLGLSKSMTMDAMSLPNNITLGFSPYSNELTELLDEAYSKGFESVLHLPMQPIDYQINDPGPYSMLINLSAAENIARLEQIASKSNKAIGFYSIANETFSQAKSSMSPVLAEIAKMQRMFIYGDFGSQYSIDDLCASLSAECVTNSMHLDETIQAQAIEKNLAALENIALAKGNAVAYIKPYTLSLNILKKWMEKLDPNTIKIVPISYMISEHRYILNKNLPQISANPNAEADKKDEVKHEESKEEGKHEAAHH